MDFLNIFIRPPGELIYFVLVITMSFSGLLMVFGQRRRRHDTRTRRYLTVFMSIALAWGVMVGGALIALLLNIDSRLILPPLERGVTALSFVLLCWVYLSADHNHWGRLPHIATVIAVLAVMLGYLVTAIQWISIEPTVDFNATLFNLIWTTAPFVLSLIAIAVCLIYFGIIVDAPLKIVFFELMAAGYGVTLLQILQADPTGDSSGLVRLAFVPAMAISVLLVYRVITANLEAEASVSANTVTPPPSIPAHSMESSSVGASAEPYVPRNPIERESVQMLRALGRILENVTPSSMPSQVVSTVLDTLRADVGALMRVQDANYADFLTAYDRMMKRVASGISLNLEHQPTLVNALERRVQRPLFPDRNLEELEDLYSRLEIEEIGPAYYQPLVHDGNLIGILLVAQPYTKRELSVGEEELLKGIAVIAGGLLALSFEAMDNSLMAEERAIQALVQGVNPSQLDKEKVLAARFEMQQSLQLAREQIAELSKQVVNLKLELDRERNRVAASLGESEDGLSVSQQMLAINTEQQQLRTEREQLMARLQEAQAALASASGEDDSEVLQQMINALQREREELMAERQRLQSQIEDLRKNDGMVVPDEISAVVERMSDEKARLEVERDDLREKLTSIRTQLKRYGIEDTSSGVAPLITRLYEERALLQAKADKIAAELETVRMNPEKEQEYQSRIQALTVQLKHLASDREALVRQRDQFRKQRDEMNAKLESVKSHRVRLLAQVSNLEMELKEAHDEQSKLRLDVQKLADERSDVFNQLAQIMAQKDLVTAERDQFAAQLQGQGISIISASSDELASLQNMVTELSEQRNKLTQQVNQLKRGMAELQNQLGAAQVRAKAAAPDISPEFADTMISLAQELRTPLTSVVGYLDLLLVESAGILGDMQRKFLQRIASNVVRLNGMISDLIYVAKLDTGRFTLEQLPVDVVGVLEEVITTTTPQLREKGLTVTLNIEESIPNITGDREAIQQVFGQMVTNAYLVSPPDAEISISIGLRKVILTHDDPKARPVQCIYLTVEDRGGGVMPEDEARVFARRYQAENPLIPGLGDTGVGLAIAKTYVEAHQGRLWLESRQGVGSSMHAVLPINGEVRA